MNMLLFTEADLAAPGIARVTGRRFRQLIEVIRAEPGKMCKAGMLRGSVGRAELLRIDGESAEFALRLDAAPPAPLAVTLVAALPRPLTFAKLIHGAVTAGVKRICFIHSSKVEKSYWQSSRIAPDEVREAVVLALEQCCDTVPPEITFHPRFKPFVEELLPGLASGKRMLLGSPGASLPVPVGAARGGEVLLAVGPEGGFSEYEESRFVEAGATPVSLGARILRTEFAVASLLALLGAETDGAK